MVQPAARLPEFQPLSANRPSSVSARRSTEPRETDSRSDNARSRQEASDSNATTDPTRDDPSAPRSRERRSDKDSAAEPHQPKASNAGAPAATPDDSPAISAQDEFLGLFRNALSDEVTPLKKSGTPRPASGNSEGKDAKEEKKEAALGSGQVLVSHSENKPLTLALHLGLPVQPANDEAAGQSAEPANEASSGDHVELAGTTLPEVAVDGEGGKHAPAPATQPELAFSAQIHALSGLDNGSANKSVSPDSLHATPKPQAPGPKSELSSENKTDLKPAAEQPALATKFLVVAASVNANASAAPSHPTSTIHAPAQEISVRSIDAAAPLVATADAAPASGPVRDISIQVPGADAQQLLQVLVSDRGGSVQVDVRSSDPALNQSLRGNLDELIGRLDKQGMSAETWTPSGTTAASGSSDANLQQHSQDSPGSDPRQQQQRGEQQGQGRRRHDDQAQEPRRGPIAARREWSEAANHFNGRL